jgi:hypothetical protein
MIAIVVLVTSAAGYAIFGLAEETEPVPDVAMEVEPTGDGVTYTLRHVSGEDLTGNQTRLTGVADEDALHGERLRASETIEVVPVGTEVKLLWYGDGEGYTLDTFDVGPDELAFDVGTIDNRCDFVEQEMTGNSGDLDLDDNSTLVGDIDGESQVDGAVVVDGGSLDLASVDVDGPVYADPDDVSCSGSTLGPDDESCSEYSYRDPDDY